MASHRTRVLEICLRAGRSNRAQGCGDPPGVWSRRKRKHWRSAPRRPFAPARLRAIVPRAGDWAWEGPFGCMPPRPVDSFEVFYFLLVLDRACWGRESAFLAGLALWEPESAAGVPEATFLEL